MSPADDPLSAPVPVPLSGRAAIRAQLFKALANQDFDLAVQAGIRLSRLEPHHPDDLAVAAMAWIGRGEPEQATRLLDQALRIDPRHALTAKAMAGLGPLPAQAVEALRWHAETDPEAATALIAHVQATGAPQAYLCARNIRCILPPGTWQVGLRWRHLMLVEAMLEASQQMRVVALGVPDALRGAVDPVMVVNGADLPQGPFAANLLAPPRLAALLHVDSALRWVVQATDQACPMRPVALLLRDATKVLSRHVAIPAPGTAPAGPGDMPPMPIDIPAGTSHPNLVFELTGEPAAPASAADDGTVDVIVPVHGDHDATRACLDALLGCDPGTAMRVLAIDDASPDPRISRMLDGLAAQGRIELVRNPGNLGFVRSVNIGMARHAGRDVVLLNADTVVAAGWLSRLRAAAHAQADTGTVTPWSNDATICSYPTANGPTPLAAVDVAALDRLAAHTLAGRTETIPTAVGFCMYIRRDCLARTGWFDAQAFGTGYGEENDFCLRATEAGWRHRIALDLYVGHVGGGSFGAAKQARIDKALAVLESRYPGYQAGIHAFIAADPLRTARRLLDLAQLQGDAGRPLLIVCAKLGGGTDRFINQVIRQYQDQGRSALILRPERPTDAPTLLRLEVPGRPDLTNLIYDAGSDLDRLRADLAGLGVAEMELHHPSGLPAGLLPLLAGWFPFRAHVHDYGWICPRFTLTDGNDRYCGEPDAATCDTCIKTHGDPMGLDRPVAEWRSMTRQVLEKADIVGCASHDSANRMRRYMPAANFQVSPAEPPLTPPASRFPARSPREALRVVVPGAIGPPKGFGILLACARDAAARNLPLQFRVLGYSMDDDTLVATGHVQVTGRYEEAEVPGLLDILRPHAAFLPSIWPETWCYALSHVMAAGLPVASFDLGAQAERLRAGGHRLLLPTTLTAGGINDALLADFG
ncbi:glycosyltransferase [Niveispirillum sp. KHB5.9]|uniref:glycosyltransferase n=1 Tax=Niveispirillum sp. KHB5.9 TaxID=3400269 RepID=UPI003A85160E